MIPSDTCSKRRRGAAWRFAIGAPALLAILLPPVASAGDEPVQRIDYVELYPTWSAVGIEVAYTGSPESIADAAFVWRRAHETDWRPGVDMTFNRARQRIWASIWPLEPGETVEVRIDFSVPDAAPPPPHMEQVTTRTMTLDPPPAGTHYYVAPHGNDWRPGTQRQPFQTLRHAASIAGPGDAIVVRGGVYREGDLFSRMIGTPDAPIVIMAADGETPILDGSIEIPRGADGWEALGDGIHARHFPNPPRTPGYVAQDGERIFRFRTMEDLRLERFETGWGDTFVVARGWYFDADAQRLYVRLRSGASPADSTFNVAVHDYGVLLAASRHVVLRGFEIRHYGRACVRISDGAAGCVVYANHLRNAPAGVFVFGETTADNAVWSNRIHEAGLTAYPWGQSKRSGDQRQGITGWAGAERGRMGRGMSFCYNDIRGWFDGIMPGGWNRVDRFDLSRDMDIMHNYIADIGDDAIEIDGGPVNQRVHGNTIRNAFAALALAPVEKGPVYVTRNDATFYALGFKLNVGGPESLGWAYCYHNSLYCLSRGRGYGGTGISFPPAATMPIANKVFKNNVLIVDGLGIRYGQSSFTFDHNLYASVPESGPVSHRWDWPRGTNDWETATYRGLEALRAATGQEAHGLETDPRFVATPGLGAFPRGDYGDIPFADFIAAADSTGADLSLHPDSPAIDAGVAIRGINEDHLGAAPDIGAHEWRPADEGRVLP